MAAVMRLGSILVSSSGVRFQSVRREGAITRERHYHPLHHLTGLRLWGGGEVKEVIGSIGVYSIVLQASRYKSGPRDLV